MCLYQQNIFQFLSENSPILFNKWQEKLNDTIREKNNKVAANGMAGSGTHFASINTLMIENIKNLISELIRVCHYSMSCNKITRFKFKKFETALNQQISQVLDKYEGRLSKEMEPYSDRTGDVFQKLKKMLHKETKINLYLLLNKFEYDLFNTLKIKKVEKRAFTAHLIAWISIIVTTFSGISQWLF